MERVFEIIEEQLHLTGVQITEDSSFKDDLGADSIDLVELVMDLGRKPEARFSTGDIKYISENIAKNLRRKMYNHVQNYSFANIDKFSPSSIITRHTTDVNNVQMSFQMLTRIAIRAPLMLIFSLTMACFVYVKIV